MTQAAAWPELVGVLDRLRTEPSRTGSVILTVFGDAILPRGGEVAMADLLVLMQRLGASEGVVRTAVSRLTQDGWLERHRIGRNSYYSLSPQHEAEFVAASPRIYRQRQPEWGGGLLIAWPEPGADRKSLENAGWALCTPGVLIAPDFQPLPDNILHVRATGSPSALRTLADRSWPLGRINVGYARFLDVFGAVEPASDGLAPLDALATRVMLIHEHRRVALRDPGLPTVMLPDNWHGNAAWQLCKRLYQVMAPGSELWLDTAERRSGPLPRGPDPAERFSGGGSKPPERASSPKPRGSRHPPQSG